MFESQQTIFSPLLPRFTFKRNNTHPPTYLPTYTFLQFTHPPTFTHTFTSIHSYVENSLIRTYIALMPRYLRPPTHTHLYPYLHTVCHFQYITFTWIIKQWIDTILSLFSCLQRRISEEHSFAGRKHALPKVQFWNVCR